MIKYKKEYKFAEKFTLLRKTKAKIQAKFKKELIV